MPKFHGNVPVADQQVLAGIFSGVEVNFEIDTDAKKLYLVRAGSAAVTALDIEEGEIPDPETPQPEPESDEANEQALDEAEIEEDEEEEDEELDG